jgi:hypothetical protein
MKMKRTLVAATLLTFAGAASAGLSWSEIAGEGTIPGGHPFDSIPGISYTGTSFASAPNVSLGKLTLDNAAKVTYTYLGSEAGYDNNFWIQIVDGALVFSTRNNAPPAATTIGTSITVNSAAGDLDFTFEGSDNKFAKNGGTWSADTSIGLIKNTVGGSADAVGSYTVTSGLAAGKTFQYIIGYNDSAAGLTDWDDMVIGINIAPIPEPETYAMLLAGLGLMGFVARRRKQSVVTG